MVRENKASKFDFKNSNCESKNWRKLTADFYGGSAAPFGASAPTSPRQSPFFTHVKYNGLYFTWKMFRSNNDRSLARTVAKNELQKLNFEF